MKQVRQIMGMPIIIDIDKCDDESVFKSVFDRLAEIDNRFSTYKPDSEVSQYINGEIDEVDLSPELKKVIKACRAAEDWTGGYFSAWAAGGFDPSGYVKGWAISEAGKEIEKHDYRTYCISAGGDILACSKNDKKWQIGVQDPTDRSKILDLLSISNGAVATSGNYERGRHIINPKTKKPADDLLSVTITGPDIIKADILATACFAMGSEAADFIKNFTGYQALIIANPRSRESNR